MSDTTPTEPAAQIRGLTPVSRLLTFISCLFLFGMMIFAFADVVGRNLFLSPLPAAYEIISLLMPAVIFCALPLTVLREGHVTVDLLDNLIPRSAARAQGVIVSLISAVALGLVTWRLAIKTLDDLEYETLTDELLLMVWPFGLGMAVLCAIATLACLANAWLYAAGRKNRG